MDFKPGFRFSTTDAAVLAVGLISAAVCCGITALGAVLLLFVLAHFFVFCNVIRMSRLPELIWAAAFLLLASTAILTGKPSWPIVFAAAFALTVLLIGVELRKPSYHGVLWQSINPDLPHWFQESVRSRGRASRQ
jgi:hypothetical protein